MSIVQPSLAGPTPQGAALDYGTAVQRLLNLANFEWMRDHAPVPPKAHLHRMEAFLERLGNPHLQVPAIHIAGTKGKGSTAAMIASALRAHGYRTGLFTSPHLHTFRERIQLDGEPLTEEAFAALVDCIWPALEELKQEERYGQVTTFEALTAMGFLLFSQRSCDYAVVEVGLGGRLDSTNVVRPRVCVITSISLDHTSVLGETVVRIAGEKAGIIKDGATVIAAPQPPEALEAIRAACLERNAILVYVPERYGWCRTGSTLEGQSVTITGPGGPYHLWMPLLGWHQLENAATAVAVLAALQEQGTALSHDGLIQGFREGEWPCRMEVLSQDPLMVADGAHNPYSTERLRESLRDYLDFQGVVLVMGASADKNLDGIVRELVPLAPRVVATRSRHPRAAPTDVLCEAFRHHDIAVEAVVDDVGQAVARARDLVAPRDLVLITGSLFVAAEAREAVKGIPPELYPGLQP